MHELESYLFKPSYLVHNCGHNCLTVSQYKISITAWLPVELYLPILVPGWFGPISASSSPRQWRPARAVPLQTQYQARADSERKGNIWPSRSHSPLLMEVRQVTKAMLRFFPGKLKIISSSQAQLLVSSVWLGSVSSQAIFVYEQRICLSQSSGRETY